MIANVLDLELDAEPDNPWPEIIEIGITEVDLDHLVPLRKFSIPIRTEFHPNATNRPDFRPLAPQIEKLTGWTRKKLEKQGVYMHEAKDRLRNKFGSWNRLLVTDQSDETAPFCWNESLDPFGTERINVSMLFRIMYQRLPPYRSMSLENMLAHVGLKLEGRQHRADWDSWNIARLFCHLMKLAREGVKDDS